MFPGYIILATFSILNPAVKEGTIQPSQYQTLQVNYINLQNYDLEQTALGIENLEVSHIQNTINLNDGDSEFFRYNPSNVVANTADDYVYSFADTDTTATKSLQIDFVNSSSTEALTYSFDNIYLLAKQNNANAGGEIIDGITAGLGLMSPIANEFLTGFSALFWDSTANSGAGGLTTFGNFALIFMGVSITFAVVKLALNLIRGKTGA